MGTISPLKKTDASILNVPVLKDCVAFDVDNAPGWVQDIRKFSIEDVQLTNLPQKSWERFKYSDLRSFVNKIDLKYVPTALDKISHDCLSNIDVAAENVIPEWVASMMRRAAAGEAEYGDMALWHLNNAYLRSGIVIHIPEKKIEYLPINVTFSGRDGEFTTPRSFIRAEPGSHITLIENCDGQGTYWTNALTQIYIARGATIRHYRIQNHSERAVFTQNTHVEIEEGGTYDAFTLTKGAGFSRNQIHIDLCGPNAVCHLNGINILCGMQLGDTTITIDHKAPNCNSNQNYRSVIDDQARGVFQGKVHVHKIAQKTDGYQLSNALLLSEGAEMDTKPELEIYADDVKCSHGALCGQLDETPLFYLRSRGIPKAEARAMLIQSFVGELVDKIEDKSVQTTVEEMVTAWLKR